eukprot:TRINITY_DN89684_c0_g1_i1.p1 TRINITY_DN89684_c0_g1~~TRINITY_DN89684_c0_g1_i1.p1  ORF type:complete len:191 (+),score=55.07 TRINITY_DN89684_c0_g1_i1:47-574(+)
MSDWDDEEWDESAATKAKPKFEAEEDESDEEPAKNEPAPKTAESKPDAKEESKPSSSAPKDDQKVIHKNSLDELEIKLQSDVDWLVKMVVPKLKDSNAKRAPHKFLTDAINGLSLKLSLEEATQIAKISKDFFTKRKKAVQEEERKKLEEEEKKKKEELLPQNEVSDADYFKDFM